MIDRAVRPDKPLVNFSQARIDRLPRPCAGYTSVLGASPDHAAGEAHSDRLEQYEVDNEVTQRIPAGVPRTGDRHAVDAANLPWWAFGIGVAFAIVTSVLASRRPAKTMARVPVVAALSGRPRTR